MTIKKEDDPFLISLSLSPYIKPGAAYLRKFVREHNDYKFDSVVTPKISYDLIHHIIHIGRGEIHPPECE
jgi:glutamate--cysteine ligase catalytic subunit